MKTPPKMMSPKQRRERSSIVWALTLSVALPLFSVAGFAQTKTQHAIPTQPGGPVRLSQAASPNGPKPQGMEGMDMGKPSANVPQNQKPIQAPASDSSRPNKPAPMGSMQGGKAPANARDPNAYADGYDYGTMPGMEQADKIRTNSLLMDQLEFTHGREGDGFAWDIHDAYGPDEWKLLLRTEGAVTGSRVDFTTGAEALWWNPLTAFWGTVLGLHQDFGPGAHTSLAFGIEGLAPYWVQVEATGYVDETGRLSARLKGFYDVLLTNRLILTPEVQTNLFSRVDEKRGVGDGFNNIELSVRLRYEFTRSFAPYIGFDWDRALGSAINQRIREGEPVNDGKFVAGLRILW